MKLEHLDKQSAELKLAEKDLFMVGHTRFAEQADGLAVGVGTTRVEEAFLKHPSAFISEIGSVTVWLPRNVVLPVTISREHIRSEDVQPDADGASNAAQRFLGEDGIIEVKLDDSEEKVA